MKQAGDGRLGLLKLLVENGVTNTAVLERLNGERCMELNLPYVPRTCDSSPETACKPWFSMNFSMIFACFRSISRAEACFSARFGCAQVLIEACQKRWTSEKMNLGQDKGGVVEKEDPFMKLLEANKERVNASGSARRFELISDGFRRF